MFSLISTKLRIFLGGLITLSCMAVYLPSASADMVKGAATGCFPRVFSQIDQFKSSSGGLRNESATPKSIVCSVDNDTYAEAEEARNFDGYIHVEELTAEMECTSYMRSIYGGGLVDSHTEIFGIGEEGDLFLFSGDSIGISGLENVGDIYEVYTYVQCKVPANGRVFGLEFMWDEPAS